MKIKKLLVINVPIKNCNLRCDYCYITALNQIQSGPAVFKYDPIHVGKCLSRERLGGRAIINLTGGGETLLPREMPQYIYRMLEQGHFLEVVTNGTLSSRFDEIAKFPKEYLSRLEFKFSFHFIELKKKNLLDVFFNNVRKMSCCGCSYTVELMPYDKLTNYIPEIIEMCQKELGAVCQTTIGRNDLLKGKPLLTDMSYDEYRKNWDVFDSPMYDFKLQILNKKVKNFCYAGLWSLYIDLGTGLTKQCYGQLYNQNIFEDPASDIIYRPVGFHCKQPYCYNGHAFLSLGIVPEIDAPNYAVIRNRVKNNGDNWLKSPLKEAFEQKLYTHNDKWDLKKKLIYEMKYPFVFLKDALYDWKEIYEKVIKKIFIR